MPCCPEKIRQFSAKTFHDRLVLLKLSTRIQFQCAHLPLTSCVLHSLPSSNLFLAKQTNPFIYCTTETYFYIGAIAESGT
mmetsp:Transcript_21106/g.39510  ORF Transcript_21106/g.39510 Transcript_21106/m.39510 type:complete len:80 (+) Transcript_21106:36-275(+)